MTPTISVIIPMYNAEAFVARCFESLLAQTFQDFEVVAVDDGSIDGTLAVAQQLAQGHDNIRIFHTENGGHTAARGFGCAQARGEFIKMLDVDDTLPPDALELLITHARQHDLDMVQGSANVIWESGKITLGNLGSKGIIDSKEYASRMLRNEGVGNPNVSMYRRSLVGSNTFRLEREIKLYEDTYISLTMALRARRIGLFPDIVIHNYHQHSDSLTHTIKIESARPYQLLTDHVEQAIKTADINYDYRQDLLNRRFHYALECCFNNLRLHRDAWVRSVLQQAGQLPLSSYHQTIRRAVLSSSVLFVLLYAVNYVRRAIGRIYRANFKQ
ncbi:MAG: glycosyltransferase [Bacteroidaceae bacterium]|nr:glycosyltransferase [Bacteroidaceae bacterium]